MCDNVAFEMACNKMKFTKKVKNISIILVVGCMISACGPILNPPEYAEVINKPQRVKTPIYLWELKDIRPWEPTLRWLLPPQKPACYHRTSECSRPPINVYLKDPTPWKQWLRTFDRKTRVVDIIPKGTAYHVSRVYVPGKMSGGTTHVYVVFDSGKYKGQEIKDNNRQLLGIKQNNNNPFDYYESFEY